MFNKNYALCIVLLAASFGISSCAKAGGANEYNGLINDDFIQFIEQQKEGNNIVLTSNGGNETFALKAADIIIKKKLTATIRGYCMSSCVDFLFPAFEKINLDHFPTIGLHGNTHLTNVVIQKIPEQASKIPENIKNDCLAKEQHLMKIWRDRKTYYSIIDDNLLESKADHIRVDGKGCGVVFYGYGYWFPTSDQLKQIFGNKFTGNVCSDSAGCVSKVIINGAKTTNYKKIKVGDKEVVISETQ